MTNPGRNVLRRHRGALTAVYGAIAVENAFDLLYPFAIGLAIDDLLARSSTRGLWLFVGIWSLHTVVGVARQRYDTRVFSAIYAETATDLVTAQRAAGAEVSMVAARATLARELVDAFDADVARLIAAAFAVLGSLVMLYLYDPLLGAVATLLVVPVWLLNRRLARRSRPLHAQVHDQLEGETELIRRANRAAVTAHYRLLARRRVVLSDTHAATWGLLEVFAIALAVFAFLRTTDVTAEPGRVFATVAYVFAYLTGFEDVPELTQQAANLRDIARRLDAGTAGEQTRPEP